MSPKVSVVVPVYNGGEYFINRLESLINQTLKEIEIILVLDCPTDGSDKIAYEYALKDERIRIIANTNNLHIGLSRNEGIKAARGKYICFSDDDDDSTLDMYEKLYRKAEDCEADVVVSDFYRVKGDELCKFVFPAEMNHDLFRNESLLSLLKGEIYKENCVTIASNGVIWNHLIKTDFLKRHKIYFCDNRKCTFEDRLFLIQVYRNAKFVVHINECLYYHYCIKNSAGGKYTYHSYKLIISYLQRLKNYLIDQNMYQLYHKYYADSVLIFLFYAFRNETKHKCYKTLIQEIRKIRKNYMLQYELHSLVKDKGLSLLKEYSVWKCIYLIMIYGFIRTKSYSV